MITSIFILLLVSCKEEQKAEIITENKSYMIMNSNTFDLEFYLEDKYSFYLDPKYITQIYLFDKLNKYELEINKLKKAEESIKHHDSILNKYKLNVTLNYDFDNLLKIPKCNLEINYDEIDSIVLNIGSFTIINQEENEHIYISGYKGIVNDVISKNNDYYPTIVGTILTIKNSFNQDVLIKKITSLNGHIEINQNQITTIENLDIHNNVNINDIIEGDYQLMYKNKITHMIIY